MAKNKKYVYLQLYPKDLMADEKLAKCDKASAWGAYLALLNIMSMEDIRGCVRLRDWDSHPNNERKSLVANFRKANSLRTKAAAFARVVSQCTPLKIGPIAEGIEQLLIFGVVVMHDDALIQPRMFRDSHSVLEGYEPEPEPAEETAAENADKGASAPPKKEKNKEGVAPARTLRANTHTRSESEHKNNNDSIGNIGGAGGDAPDKPKTKKNNPEGENGASDGVEVGGVSNLPQEKQKRATKPEKGEKDDSTAATQKKKKQTVADNPPTLEEVQAYFEKRASQGKPFQYITAEQFVNIGEADGWMRHGKPLYSWEAYLRNCEDYRRQHGDKPIGQAPPQTIPKPGDPVAATKPTGKKYKDKW